MILRFANPSYFVIPVHTGIQVREIPTTAEDS
jgi:hypothetical protein